MRAFSLIAATCALLGACGDAALQQERAIERRNAEQEISEESIFDLFRDSGSVDRGVAVNRELWQASLDVLSFLPVEGADPFSGLIVTDWGRVAGDPAPYRVTVYISEPALDARSIKVAAFRQQGGRAVAVGEAENRQLENAILTRARQMRIAGFERRA